MLSLLSFLSESPVLEPSRENSNVMRNDIGQLTCCVHDVSGYLFAEATI